MRQQRIPYRLILGELNADPKLVSETPVAIARLSVLESRREERTSARKAASRRNSVVVEVTYELAWHCLAALRSGDSVIIAATEQRSMLDVLPSSEADLVFLAEALGPDLSAVSAHLQRSPAPTSRRAARAIGEQFAEILEPPSGSTRADGCCGEDAIKQAANAGTPLRSALGR